jgi:hypothetical protein
MSKVITYSVDEILNYKNVNVNILTEELSNIFDSINVSFLQSTQYLENRKKINYNQINSSKWKKINSNINTKLLSLLNKITDETFSNILEKILNSNIINDSQLNKLADDFMSKIMGDIDNNKLYCLLIKQIIDSGLWYFKKSGTGNGNGDDYINLRIYFIDKLQKEYDINLTNIDLLYESYRSNEDEFFEIKKNMNAIINTIINLHLSNILSDASMDYVIDSLKAKYSDKNMDVIEYLCKINEIHNYEDVELFLDDLLTKNITSRYKFMIEDLKNKPTIKAKNVDVKEEYKKFLNNGNLDILKKNVGGKLVYIDLLKFLFDKIVSVDLNELEKFIGLIKKVKDRMNPKEYNEYIEENLDEVISELPILEKYKSRFQ